MMAEATTTPNSDTGLWSQQKNKLRAKFPELNDSDLKFEENRRDEMMNNIQIKLHKTKMEIAEVMAGW